MNSSGGVYRAGVVVKYCPRRCSNIDDEESRKYANVAIMQQSVRKWNFGGTKQMIVTKVT